MGKFDWSSVILHNDQSFEVRVVGCTEVEDEYADDLTRARGLYGLVKVLTKNLTKEEDQYHVVDTYEELTDFLFSSYAYLLHMRTFANNFIGGSDEIIHLREAHKRIFIDVCPAYYALKQIRQRVNDNGWTVSLDIDEYESDESDHSDSDEAVATPSPPPVESPRPQSPLPNPIPMPIQNQVQPTTLRTPPVPAPRKKIPTALAPAAAAPIPVAKTNKTAPILNETAPPPSYRDVMEPKNGMENYYGRGEQAAAPKVPTVEITPSIRGSHLPVSAQPVVFRTHTAHQTPSVLDRIGTMTLDAASRIAEANSNLATAALQKMKKLKVTKTYGYGVT